MTNDEPADNFWLLLPHLIDVVRDDFVTPALLAAASVSKILRARILSWLQPYEAAAKAELLARALELNPKLTPPPLRKPTKRRVKPAHVEDRGDPTTWRVSFPILKAMAYEVRPGPKKRRWREQSAMSLARRIEALIRVSERSEAYALRLSRRLWRFEYLFFPRPLKLRKAWPTPMQFTLRQSHEKLQRAIIAHNSS